MKISIEHNNKDFIVDTSLGVDISIPTDFKNNIGPKFYDKSPPSVNYYKTSNHEYNLDKNKSCNVPIINLNIHCSGTHTESAKHILKDASPINKIKCPTFIACQLISVLPEQSLKEEYHAEIDNKDQLITKEQLMKSLGDNSSFNEGLIIRTMPNGNSKKNRDYNLEEHPFLTNDAILYIEEIGVKHLIVDIPSIDKYDDGGKLGNHHIFFNNKSNTLTELAFIPNECKDGKYFLSLNISNFSLDAAPSRPVIFSISS